MATELLKRRRLDGKVRKTTTFLFVPCHLFIK